MCRQWCQGPREQPRSHSISLSFKKVCVFLYVSFHALASLMHCLSDNSNTNKIAARLAMPSSEGCCLFPFTQNAHWHQSLRSGAVTKRVEKVCPGVDGCSIKKKGDVGGIWQVSDFHAGSLAGTSPGRGPPAPPRPAQGFLLPVPARCSPELGHPFHPCRGLGAGGPPPGRGGVLFTALSSGHSVHMLFNLFD